MNESFKDHEPTPEELAGNSVGYCYMGGGDTPQPGSIQPVMPIKRTLVFKDDSWHGHSQ